MAVLERIPVERINERAAQIKLLPLVLSLCALPFVVLGWLVFWVRVGVSAAIKWVSAAVLVGYDMAKERRERAG